MDDSEMRSLLEFDSLAAAEELRGTSYKVDPATMMLGFGLNIENGKLKKKALDDAGDTNYGSSFVEQLDVFLDLGFEVLTALKFQGDGWDGPCEETFLVLWHSDGVLGTMESYNGDGRNTAKIYYNWKPSEEGRENMFRHTSSGHWVAEHEVWSGDHDAREALKFKFNQLKKFGEFVNPWVDPPWLWLLNYMDTKIDGYDHKAITNERLTDLPEHVRTAIGHNAR